MGKFLANWREKRAATVNEGFASFRQGKDLYFAFVKVHGEKFGCGQSDPSLMKAYGCYSTAERIAQEEKRFADVARTHVELGKICELLGEYSKAISHRKKAIELFETLPDKTDSDLESVRDSYMYLAMSLFHISEKNEAKRIADIALKKYEAAKDSYGINRLQKLLTDLEEL